MDSLELWKVSPLGTPNGSVLDLCDSLDVRQTSFKYERLVLNEMIPVHKLGQLLRLVSNRQEAGVTLHNELAVLLDSAGAWHLRLGHGKPELLTRLCCHGLPLSCGVAQRRILAMLRALHGARKKVTKAIARSQPNASETN